MARPRKSHKKPSKDTYGWYSSAAAWRPPPRLTCSQWIESGAVRLPDGTTADPGPLRFDEVPYWRGIMDWFSDRGTEEIVLACGSQLGKTTALQAGCLHASATDPGPVLWLMPTDDMAEEFMRDRFRPMIQASPALASKIPKNRSRDAARVDGVTWDHGGYMNITGVAASQKLKGKPVRFLAFDEYDECLRFNAELGDQRSRARTRLRTFAGRSKLVISSTPTGEDVGIWPIWQECQQWQYFVPCPHCGEYQVLSFAQVWWPKDEDGNHPDPEEIYRERSARYQCVRCEGHWTDAQKDAAVKAGEWRNMTPERSGTIKGAHLSAMYSPKVSLSWVVREFLDALDRPDKMIQFRNECLAEPHTRALATANTKQAVLDAREEWKQGLMPGDGDVPEDVQVIVAGADVQGDHLWLVFLGIGGEGHYYPLWAGKCPDMATAEQWSRRPWICRATGEELRPPMAMMDSGYRTAEVYEFCRQSPIWKACKGSVESPVPLRASHVARGQRGRVAGGDLVYLLAPTYFKDLVDSCLAQGRLHLPADLTEVYLKHLTAEVKKFVRIPNGGTVQRWVPRFTGAANHLLDATCYALAAALHLGLTALPKRTIEERRIHREVQAAMQDAAQTAGMQFRAGLGFKDAGRIA